MSLLDALIIMAAGLAAGTMNTIVGAGSLITFPTLLALGYAPVTANVSNTVGIVFGSVSGAVGYRRELRGQRRRVMVLGSASFMGGIVGGVLLLTLPSSVFRDVIPILILVACAPRDRAATTQRVGRGAAHAARRARRDRARTSGSSSPGSTAATSVPRRA